MIRVLFVCHGNICRSPCAEYVFKKLIDEQSLNAYCESRSTSREEIGNDIYFPMKRVLLKNHIPLKRHYATQITKDDYTTYDFILLMDVNNKRNIRYIINEDKYNKIHLLKEYVGESGEIEDPWYTQRYESVYFEIYRCLERLIQKLKDENKL